MGSTMSHGVGGRTRVGCEGVMVDTNDDNTICSFVVLL